MVDFVGFMMFVFFILGMLKICVDKALFISNALSGKAQHGEIPKHGGGYMDIPEEDEFLNKNKADDWL